VGAGGPGGVGAGSAAVGARGATVARGGARRAAGAGSAARRADSVTRLRVIRASARADAFVVATGASSGDDREDPTETENLEVLETHVTPSLGENLSLC